MRKLLIILLFALPLFASKSSRPYFITFKFYISATGSDAAAGTSSGAPWQTLTKLNSQTLSAGDTVFFNRADTFYGRLNCTRTGALGSPIVYAAYGTGAYPVITGYTTLTNWVNNGGGVYSAAAPGIKQYAHNLIMDGNFQNIARYPNTGFITYTPISTTSFTTSESSPPNHIGDSAIGKGSRYSIDHFLISGQSGSTYTISAMPYSGVGGNGFFYFNAEKWLDSLGEWVVNSTQDSIHMHFGGGTPTGHIVKVATIDTVVYATGAYNHIDSIQIIGGNMYNVLNAFGTGYLSLNGCTLLNGYTAVDLRAQHDTVKYCTIRNFLNNGIMGPTNNVAKYCGIIHNTIRAIGLLPGMGKTNTGNYEGIPLPADGFYCAYNDLDSIGYNGIFTSADSFMVKYNHINHACMTLADGGGIYTWDASKITYTHQREIVGNLVENGIGNLEGTVYDPGTMASGIYCDGKANLVLVTDNTTINNSGTGLFDHGTNVTFLRNNSYGNTLAPLMLSEFTGQPITGTIVKYNALASADTTKPCIWFYTPNTNVLSMASACDSNYFMSGTAAIASLWTQQNGASVVKRSLTDWRAFLTLDAASTHQKGKIVYAYNGSMADKNTYLTGRYTGPDATTYNQLVPTPKLYAIPLIENDKGYVTIPPGSKIVAH